MKSFSKFLAFLLILAVAQTSFARKCGEAIYSYRPERRTIVLQKVLPSPAFYMRSGRFVIVFKPDDVARLLKNSPRIARDSVLLSAITKELPLTVDTDLFKYAFTSTAAYGQANDVAGELIQSGQATMLDLLQVGIPSEMVESAIMVIVDSPKAPVAAREFCSPWGDLLLTVTDRIDD